MMRSVWSLSRNTEGAVAATVGLSLFALIAVGGIAFDYARLASMDSELQDAADQAALAAASQLDQTNGSVQRATAAAQSLLTNRTLMANDSNASGTAITIPTVVFYATKADAENDTNGFTATGSFAQARFVRVAVAARRAFYALTPVVGAFTSGDIGAEAVAGLGSAICKTPPVMICNPSETGTITTFDANAFIGVGIKLVSVGNGSGSWAPGNFGYLDSNGGSNGAPGLREALGWGTPPGDCIAQSGVDTKPGATVTVTDALNTRFDIYDSNVSCTSPGSCPASINSVKDLVRPANANGGNACKMHNQGWQEVAAAGRYLPTSATTPLPTTTTPLAMGDPRDMCHSVASGGCTGTPIGDGLWDRDAYFRVNYHKAGGAPWSSTDWQTNTGLGANATRYQVYSWEIAHRGQTIDGTTVLAPSPAGATGNTNVSYGLPVCSPTEGYGSGTVPGGAVPDRRRISVAVVNCVANNVHGSSTNIPVEKWIDVFLVEPSLNRDRTTAGDVYVEVIGETQAGAGAAAGQVVRRDVPYLIK
jgi:Flp pilus assembly protein TadG